MMSVITFDVDAYKRKERMRRHNEFEKAQKFDKRRKYLLEIFSMPFFFLATFIFGGRFLLLRLFRLNGNVPNFFHVLSRLGRFSKPYHRLLLASLRAENREERCAAAFALSQLASHSGAMFDDVRKICSDRLLSRDWQLPERRAYFATHVGIYLEREFLKKDRNYRFLLLSPYPEIRAVAAKLAFQLVLPKGKERHVVLRLLRDEAPIVRDEMVRSIHRYRNVSGAYIPVLLELFRKTELQEAGEVSFLQDPLVEEGGRLLVIVLLRMGKSLYPYLPQFVQILHEHTKAKGQGEAQLLTDEGGVPMLNLPYAETIGAALIAEIAATRQFSVTLLNAFGEIFGMGEKRFQLFALFVLSTLFESESVQKHLFDETHQAAYSQILAEIELSYFSFEEDLLIWHRNRLVDVMKEKGLR